MVKKNNSGFISAISLLIMAFLLLMTAAVVPRVRAELNFTSINSDGVEAQYAAEAGVKYTAAQILNNPSNTDWSWARGNQELTFADGETYKITIYPIDFSGKVGTSPIDDGVAMTSGSKYLIQSVGKVNGYMKTVKIIAYINTGSTSAKAIYAANNLNVNNTVTINNGDVLAGSLNMTKDIKITDGNLLYINSVTAEDWMKNNHKDNLKPYNGTYTYTPDEATITSLPAFSAASNISGYTNNYTSGVSLSAPDNSQNGITAYTLNANTKYYLSGGMPSPKNNGTLKFNKANNGDVNMTVAGNYISSNSGSGTSFNLTGTGNFVLNIIGNMTAQSFTINATNASSVTINVTGNLKTSGSGITIHGPANGDVNINVAGSLAISEGGLTTDGMNSGNVNILVDSNLTTGGYSWHITRPTTGDVNIFVKGNFNAANAGLPITGNGTGEVNLLVGGTLTSSGSGIVINSTTGNVNIFVNSDFSSSGTGLALTGSSAKIVVNGNINFGGTTSITAANSLIYVVGENHNATFNNTLTLYGSLIVADGSANINNTVNIIMPDSTGGNPSGGTGTIEFTNWSS